MNEPLTRLEAVEHVYGGLPDVMTVRPRTLGEYDPIAEQARLVQRLKEEKEHREIMDRLGAELLDSLFSDASL